MGGQQVVDQVGTGGGGGGVGGEGQSPVPRGRVLADHVDHAVEEDGGGVGGGKIDDRNGDRVRAGVHVLRAHRDRLVGGGGGASGGDSGGRDLSVGKELSEDLVAVDIEKEACFGLDADVQTGVSALAGDREGVAEQPDIGGGGGEGAHGEVAEAGGLGGGVPVGRGAALEVLPGGLVVVEGIVQVELVGANGIGSSLVEEGHGVVGVLLSRVVVDVEAGVCVPAVVSSVPDVDGDDLGGNAHQVGVVDRGYELWGREDGGPVGLVDGVVLLRGAALVDLSEAQLDVRLRTERDGQGEGEGAGDSGLDVGGGDHKVAAEGCCGDAGDGTGGGGEGKTGGEGVVDAEVLVAGGGGNDVKAVDVRNSSEDRRVVLEAGGELGIRAGVGLDLADGDPVADGVLEERELVHLVGAGVAPHVEGLGLARGGEEDVLPLVDEDPGASIVGAVDRPLLGVAVCRAAAGHDLVSVDPDSAVLGQGVGQSGGGAAGDVVVVEVVLVEDVVHVVVGRGTGWGGDACAATEEVVGAAADRGCSESLSAKDKVVRAEAAGGVVDLDGDGDGSGGGKNELVEGDGSALGAAWGGSGGGGGGGGVSGHSVSVDLSSLDVDDCAVAGEEREDVGGEGVEGGHGGGDTVVASDGGEGGHGLGVGCAPREVAEGGGVPVAGRGRVGVLPGGGEGERGVQVEGVGAILEGRTGLVGKAASEQSDAAGLDVDVGGVGGGAPAVAEGVDVLEGVLSGREADIPGLLGVAISTETLVGEERSTGHLSAEEQVEGLLRGVGGEMLDNKCGELSISAGDG